MGQKIGDDKAMQLSSSIPKMPPHPAHEPPDASASVPIKDQIGAKLQALFTEVVNEPIPEHLLELMRKLEEQDRET
jgi:hypothetical protein